MQAIAGGAADGRMDLLTVMMHELGHVLGLDDLDSLDNHDDLMAETLAIGFRRLRTSEFQSATDRVLESWD